MVSTVEDEVVAGDDGKGGVRGEMIGVSDVCYCWVESGGSYVRNRDNVKG